MERIGLLAGAGHLPIECARAAKDLNIDLYAIALLAETEEALKEVAPHYAAISIGQLDRLIAYLKENDIKDI